MKIIGIGGTNGSGKDTLGKIIAEHFDYVFLSLTETLRDEAKSRGWPPDRKATRTISQEWREEHGLAVLVQMMIKKHEASDQADKGLATSSLRNGGEPDYIHEQGGLVIWIDAPVQTRYERVVSNKREGRAVDDQKTLEEFIQDEKIEMYGKEGDEETALRTIDVKNKADIFLENTASSVEEFEAYCLETLKKYIPELQ